MARIHDLFIVELAEVIKGYGNNPDVEDPFCLSEFYRFYELPNIAISRENFEKMRPVEPERKRGEWIVWGGMDIPENHGKHKCSVCGEFAPVRYEKPLIKENLSNFCPNCGADMRGGDSNE